MILVLNCGSQSIKWKIFKDDLKEFRKGEVSNIKDYNKSLREELKKVSSLDIKRVGHRVVHGGDKYRDPVKASKKVLKELKEYNSLAPLHNPFNIMGVEAASEFFPGKPQILVFDTGIYKDLPFRSLTYALPEKARKKYNIKRYGFHGISHEYAAKKASDRNFKKIKVISCHLGGGSSVTAFKKGKVVDTSMGFTPLEGVVMMTRPGSIDPGIILKLMEDFSLKEAEEILNFKSGIKALCGEDKMLKVLDNIKKGDGKSKRALDVFVYSIQKQIGAYRAVLEGCDLLVFTGTIGFGSLKIRKMISKVFKNIKISAVEPDEELAIAEKIK